MARIESKSIATYTSDLGIVYPNVRFKLKAGRTDLVQGCEIYNDPEGICPSNGLIRRMRALIITMSDGEKVRFPISTSTNIAACVRALTSQSGVECIDLDGEEWGVVPPTIGGYTSYRGTYILGVGSKADKLTGSYDYTSDVLGLVGDKYAVETDPEELSTQLIGCLASRRDKDRCVLGAGVKARHVIAIANGAANSVIVRKGKVSTVDTVLSCISAVGNRALCMGYKGESIRNVHLLVAPEDTTP